MKKKKKNNLILYLMLTLILSIVMRIVAVIHDLPIIGNGIAVISLLIGIILCITIFKGSDNY